MLRVSDLRRKIAQDVGAGLIPLAAAHAANALQKLLGVTAPSQGLGLDDVDRLAGPVTDELRRCPRGLTDAISNVDILLDVLDATS